MANNILEKSKKFGIAITKYSLSLRENKNFEISSQVFRSGTSIGANIVEAQNAVSKKDFVNKLQISLKEAWETLYWLDILEEWFQENVQNLKKDCEELLKILVTIIKNTKQNM